MNTKNLIPLKSKGDKYSDDIRAKVKGSSSDKRKIAQQISGIKRASPNKIEQKALELATNPTTSAITIMRMIKVLSERDDLTPALQIQLIRALADAHRTIFGSKQNIDQRVESINVTIHKPE